MLCVCKCMSTDPGNASFYCDDWVFSSLFIFLPHKRDVLGIRSFSLPSSLNTGSALGSLGRRRFRACSWGARGCTPHADPQLLSQQARVKILASLVTQFDSGLKAEVLAFVLEDVRARLDLAFAWLYQEYNAYLAAGASGTLDKYEDCLIRLLSGLQEKPDQKDG